MNEARKAAHGTARRVEAGLGPLRRAWAGPGRERDLVVQSLKAALAAWVAWAVAGWWLQAPVAFVAPWVAVVLVESTVYRSIAHGLQQLGAIAVGTVMATLVGLVLPATVALALVLPVAVLLGSWRRLGSQGIYAATGALFVLTGGPVGLTTSAARIGEAAFGALVGIAVNALVRPPLYLRDARASLRDATQEAHDILAAVADGMERGGWSADDAHEWHDRALRLGSLVEQARAAIGHGRESARVNPRRRTVAAQGSGHDDALVVLDYAAVHTAGVTRTVLEATERDHREEWPRRAVAGYYAAFLRRTAEALRLYSATRFGQGDRERLEQVVEELRRMLEELRVRLPGVLTDDPEDVASYGSLLAQARRLADQLVPLGG
ncbi:aromatic acid exporter family protein [Streptomyces longwoodensis]|uniref:aromatic acid exporter family protein n=1 Tax=Streptomyces longwoodensis TaxID=68231 RepID=UPI000B14346D|nr:aromatic acid exporter family protein [Streptomyces longwoodensis]